MNKPTVILLSCLALCVTHLPAQNPAWTTAAHPWPESFGSQRAVIEITEPASWVELDLIWRRHDQHPEEHRLLIVAASSRDTTENVSRLEVNAEHCHILFGPVVKPGIYYLYYLPIGVETGEGYYGKNYLKQEPAADPVWLKKNNQAKPLSAKILQIESRTSFDNFFPMEIIPTADEKTKFLKKYSDPVLFFTEGRENPVRMKDEIPLKWVQSGPSLHFAGAAMQNEYYAFQAAVYAAAADIEGLGVETGRIFCRELPGDKGISLTCFNTAGVDPYGKPFTRRLEIPKGKVQALWIGADVPQNARPGKYSGTITISGKNLPAARISVEIEVTGRVIADRGDSEPWRHSRLRWLNSTAGSDGNPVPPYEPVKKLSVSSFIVAGHEISLTENGLPGSVSHNGTELLAAPVTLGISTPDGEISSHAKIFSDRTDEGRYSRTAGLVSNDIEVNYSVSLDYDGYLKSLVTIRNLSRTRTAEIRDVLLSIPVNASNAKYMMGMGLPGCAIPPSHESKWKGPSDSFWLGDAGAGIWCELRGSSYSGPLLNLYHPAPPASWNNQGKGGFRIIRDSSRVTAQVYSGARTINMGDSIQFEWAMLITPVKKLNPAGQFTDRYYHRGDKPVPEKADFDAGVRIINVHHANIYNPFINYPFVAVKEMRSFIDSIHGLGKKVKIYYTVRELTNHVTEIWALRSLGFEILADGHGGGYPWLREHFTDGYTPQWYHHFPDGQVDAAVLSAPGDSRWLNYYIEGLAWLVRNVDIDGLYLDDVTYDRRILQRMRSVMAREKPGCIIDLHSNTGFSIGPANQYAEFFPYVDKLWFGESFQYDKMSPENWLVEVSGIPFGLMGDMLQGGGNRWLGMVFGMTVRYPWTTEGVLCDPKPVWKIWDEFGIGDAEMTGFWNPGCAVQTDIPDVKATIYRKPGKVLLSVGNFTDQPQSVRLTIDWKKLGLDPGRCRIYAPEIENFQPSKTIDPSEPLLVEPRKGWLIYILLI